MATAALIGSDTHFILLAGEVSSAESCEGTGTERHVTQWGSATSKPTACADRCG